jgi:IS605 OrfB family transposase
MLAYKVASEVVRSQYREASGRRFKHYQKVYRKAKASGKFKWFVDKRYADLKLKYFYRTKFFNFPDLETVSVEMDSRVFNLQVGESFDEFIQIFLPWKKPVKVGRNNYDFIRLPYRNHCQSKKFIESGWKRKNTAYLLKKGGKFFVKFIYEKDEPEKKTDGKDLGLDCGYKKMLIDSEGTTYDLGMQKVYEKISRKKQGSKGFKKALKERDCLINQTVNGMNLADVKRLVVEDLKSVKKGSKFSKKFNNKLQRWSYPKVLDKLSAVCEEKGVVLERVNPTYTS